MIHRHSAFVGLACLLLAASARADEATALQVSHLKDAGNQAMLDMRYADGLTAYEGARALAPTDVTLLYNIARAHQLLGHYPDALATIERFVAEAPAETRAKVGKLDELVADLRSRVATLTLKCNVDGARVLVRDKVVGTTPLKTPLRIAAGAATIDVEMEGFFKQHREVVLPGQGSLAVDVSLAKRGTSGLLMVETDPAGARVSVDGHFEGTSSPGLELVVPAGAHKVLAQREGFDDAVSPVVLEAGSSRKVKVAMNASVPLAQRWWFWTGVGVAVAGGVVVAAVLLTEKPATPGTIAPGRISAALVHF